MARYVPMLNADEHYALSFSNDNGLTKVALSFSNDNGLTKVHKVCT